MHLFLAALFAILITSTAHAAPYTGMALLPLAAPSFPKEKALEVLKASPRPTFAFAYKAFGSDPRNIHWLIDSLVNHQVDLGAPLRVSAYLTCGPCRPPRRTGPLALPRFRPDLSIPAFNRMVERRDPQVMRDWRRHVKRFRSTHMDPRPNIEWRIYVELEDNLSDKAYTILRAQTKKILAGLPMVHFARNRYGTPARTVGSEAIEIHTYSLSEISKLRAGDAVNGDGVSRDPTAAEYAKMSAKKVDFLLWRAEWQNPNTPLKDRVYKILNVRCLKKAMRRKVC